MGIEKEDPRHGGTHGEGIPKTNCAKPTANDTTEEDKPQRKESISAKELLQLSLPPVQWIVPELIPPGLFSLAGRPKQRKSWMTLQIAKAVANGERFLGRKVSASRDVLYLALEDSEERIQERMKLQQWKEPVSHVEFIFRLPKPAKTSQGDLLGVFNGFVAQYPKTGLVIVDTLSRFLAAYGRKADQNNVTDMTEVLDKLQWFARNNKLAIIVVDHNRKNMGESRNPEIDTLGSTAKTAVADTIVGIYPGTHAGRQSHEIIWKGRDLREELHLITEWDSELHCLQVVGENGQYVVPGSVRHSVLDAIDEMAGLASTTAIASHTKKDPGNVSREISQLVEDGVLVLRKQVGKLKYYGRPEPDL